MWDVGEVGMVRRPNPQGSSPESSADASGGLGQAQADSDGCGFDASGDRELREDVADVDADGLLADEQPLTDFAVRPALRDQSQDLAFATRQPERVGANHD